MVAQKDVVIELMTKSLLLGGSRRCCIEILRVDVLVSFKFPGAGWEQKNEIPRRTPE